MRVPLTLDLHIPNFTYPGVGSDHLFEKVLEPGETIDIEPGGWVYRDHTVQMAQEVYGFKTGLLGGGSGNLVFNRFTGPGRVCLQSAYFNPAQGSDGGNSGGDTGGSLLGGIARGILDN